jgi:porin
LTLTDHMDRTLVPWASGALVLLCGMLAARPAFALATIVQPLPDQTSQAASQDTFTNGIIQRGNLLGNMFGLRSVLGEYGISLGLTETSEVLGNASGGIHQNAAYDGLTTGTLQIDTQRAFGFYGGTFNVSALDYHGRNFSADTLLNLQTSSGIEADRALRLWELWYDQKFWNNLADIKVGQQSIDQEFIVSSNALLFVNTMFGWPLVPSYDMPGGGPAYPLSALGARLRFYLTPNVTALAGVYNGSPTKQDCTGDPQQCDASGTSFPLDGDQLILGELQYSFPGNGDLVTPGSGRTLAGTYKLGFWLDTESFADQRYDTANQSLAAVDSTGDDWSVYGVADQVVWQEEDGGPKSVNAFVRAMGAPDDRNLVSFSLNAGLVMHEPIESREDDSAGLALGYGKISSSASGLDRDTQQATGSGFVRSGETFIEATYQYVPFDWWQIQPDFQYVFNPGGGIANPDQPTQKIHNEAIFGLRTNIVF